MLLSCTLGPRMSGVFSHDWNWIAPSIFNLGLLMSYQEHMATDEAASPTLSSIHVSPPHLDGVHLSPSRALPSPSLPAVPLSLSFLAPSF